LTIEIVCGVRVDCHFEQELLEQLSERFCVTVGPAAGWHAVDLVDIHDQTLPARVIMHRVALTEFVVEEVRRA
jgi:hypothetical protein